MDNSSIQTNIDVTQYAAYPVHFITLQVNISTSTQLYLRPKEKCIRAITHNNKILLYKIRFASGELVLARHYLIYERFFFYDM